MLSLAALLLLAAPAAYFAFSTSRIHRELSKAQIEAAEWRRKYADRQNEFATLRQEALASPPNVKQSAIGLAPPVFFLTVAKGPAATQSSIAISRLSPWIVFALERPPGPDFQSYRASIFASDRLVYQVSDLKPATGQPLGLSVRSELLRPGKCVLSLEGQADLGYSLVDTYYFQVFIYNRK